MDDGRLTAYLDDELGPDERARVEERLEASGEARAALEAVRRRRAGVEAALGRLPTPEPNTDDVRRRVLATVARPAVRAGRPGAWSRRPLAQAAVLVLLLGAAAVSAAVPGSPVRGWLDDVLGGAPEAPPVPSEAATAAPDVDVNVDDDVGLRVRPEQGRVEIDLDGVPPSWEVVVRMVDGDHAAVYAPRGAFASGAGSIRMEMGVDAPVGDGIVRIEIPRALAGAVLRVDGTVILDKRGERMDFPGPTARVSGDTIRFGGASG